MLPPLSPFQIFPLLHSSGVQIAGLRNFSALHITSHRIPAALHTVPHQPAFSRSLPDYALSVLLPFPVGRLPFPDVPDWHRQSQSQPSYAPSPSGSDKQNPQSLSLYPHLSAALLS